MSWIAIKKQSHKSAYHVTRVPCMLRILSRAAVFSIAALIGLGLASCGGGAQSPATTTSSVAKTSSVAEKPEPVADITQLPKDVVAMVGHTPITKAALDHWMTYETAEDVYGLAGITPPKGMLSVPVDLARCAKGIEFLQALSRKGGRATPKLDAGKTCGPLSEAIEQQALTSLILSTEIVSIDAEQGLRATDAEIRNEFKALEAKLYPTEAALRSYLANRDATVSDVLVGIKRNLLGTKLLEKLLKTSGEKGYAAYFLGAIKKWTAKTTCRAGYVAKGCKEYVAPAASPASPSVSIEKILGLA